ncbi:hypothetical protein BD289DRAFT_449168 [Coniella lustricola]|uniref:Glucose receptor Git3 N-terminal domain-containing protein n=1 Tax=Coniella lustricola TaxID=2025994 RepID=A0A2T3ANS4_9PEZI|nr:hypothetical protein BD289DRAFT_449168 [Coniella lustricola]
MSGDPEPKAWDDSSTLTPLPQRARQYVIAIGVIGLVSYLACTALFIFITYRLLQSRFASRKRNGPSRPRAVAATSLSSTTQGGIDDMIYRTFDKMTLGANHQLDLQQQELAGDMTKVLAQQGDANKQDLRKPFNSRSMKPSAADAAGLPSNNSFLTLIYHLLFADMAQSLAYTCSLTWWHKDGIFVPSANCAAQGFLVQLGSVSCAMFLTSISINTLLAMRWGYKFSHRLALTIAAANWIFSFALAFIGIGAFTTLPSENDGWYFARSASLCWINKRYAQRYGFWLQNFWIALSVGITIICYTWIFLSWAHRKWVRTSKPWFGISLSDDQQLSVAAETRTKGHHPAFFVYPIIYILCSGPIIFAGLVAAAGSWATNDYVSTVSVVSSLSGLLDAILWSTTIIFSSHQALEEVGLARYDFVRTPARLYGNIVSVEGATRNRPKGQSLRSSGEGKWRKLNGSDGPARGSSVDTLDGRGEDAIRLDTITTVTVDYLHRP